MPESSYKFTRKREICSGESPGIEWKNGVDAACLREKELSTKNVPAKYAKGREKEIAREYAN